MNREEKLKEELREIQRQKTELKREAKRQENYEYFKKRPSIYMIGKAYVTPKHAMEYNTSSGYRSLDILVTIPGNCSHTYSVSDAVPSAVKTYFHNIMSDKVKRKLQDGIDSLIKKIVEETASTPHSVLEMMGLQSNDWFLDRTDHFPQDKLQEIRDEIAESAFLVLDKFDEEEFLGMPKLYHSSSILLEYAESRKLERLLKLLKGK